NCIKNNKPNLLLEVGENWNWRRYLEILYRSQFLMRYVSSSYCISYSKRTEKTCRTYGRQVPATHSSIHRRSDGRRVCRKKSPGHSYRRTMVINVMIRVARFSHHST